MIHTEGVLQEAERVLALPLSRTARQVHGLRYLDAYLHGRCGLAETIRLWQQQVRHYARRQLTWFRANPRIRWLTIAQGETTEAVVERILRQLDSDQVTEWPSDRQTLGHLVTRSPGH
jgi:tRNA dimethylallyltransferase